MRDDLITLINFPPAALALVTIVLPLICTALGHTITWGLQVLREARDMPMVNPYRIHQWISAIGWTTILLGVAVTFTSWLNITDLGPFSFGDIVLYIAIVFGASSIATTMGIRAIAVRS